MNPKIIPFFSCGSCNKEFKFGKCPFNFKPNLKIALRKRYKLHCINCGISFSCPAEFKRVGYKRKPVCGECYADSDYPYEDADYDEQEYIDEMNRRRYGEY